MAEQYTLKECEEKLGSPKTFIPNEASRKYLVNWCLGIGMKPAEVYGHNIISLANIYIERMNERDKESTELQRVAADLTIRFAEIASLNKIDPSVIRQIFAEEVAKQPAKRIEIAYPDGRIIGYDGMQHHLTPTILKLINRGRPIMLSGPAGCGKTTIAERCAHILGLNFYLTSALNEIHDLIGHKDGNGIYHPTAFRHAFEYGGLWIPDELDAWDATVFLAANAALANGFCVFPDNTRPLRMHGQFRVCGTANTFGLGADNIYIGRNQLDAATLDRFGLVRVDYDKDLERQYAAGNNEWLQLVWSVREAVVSRKIRHVVSSRAIIYGAEALADGLTLDEVKEIWLFKGMSVNDRKKIEQPLRNSKTTTTEDDDVPF